MPAVTTANTAANRGGAEGAGGAEGSEGAGRAEGAGGAGRVRWAARWSGSASVGWLHDGRAPADCAKMPAGYVLSGLYRIDGNP